MALTYGTIWGDYGDEKVTSTTADLGLVIGTRLILPDGRVYRYAFSDGASGAGRGVQSSIALANQDTDLVPAATAVGAKSVTFKFGTSPNTDVAANDYASGYLFVNNVDGEGHVYRIRDKSAHVAADVSTSPDVVVYLQDSDPIVEALTTSSKFGLVATPYMHVIPPPAGAQTARCVGYAPAEVADDSYFWVQTWGEAALLTDGTLLIFRPVRVSDGVAGAVEEYQNDQNEEEQEVGFATNFLAATTEYQFVFLTISP